MAQPVAKQVDQSRQVQAWRTPAQLLPNAPGDGHFFKFQEGPLTRQFVVYSGPLGRSKPGDLQVVKAVQTKQ